MVGLVASASSLAQFAGIYPSAGSFITYITRALGTKVAVAVGVITILGYIIAFGGTYIFVGRPIAQNVFGNPRIGGLTQIITIAYGALGVLGLRFGVRVTVLLHAFEVILLLVMSVTILAAAVTPGCQTQNPRRNVPIAVIRAGQPASGRLPGTSLGPDALAGVIVNKFLCLA